MSIDKVIVHGDELLTNKTKTPGIYHFLRFVLLLIFFFDFSFIFTNYYTKRHENAQRAKCLATRAAENPMIRLLIDFEYEIGKQKLPMQQLNFNAKELRQEN